VFDLKTQDQIDDERGRLVILGRLGLACPVVWLIVLLARSGGYGRR
jgi:hypothetical protein